MSDNRELIIPTLALTALLSTPASGEFLFLEIKDGGIKGESEYPGYEEQIEVLAWSWGLSQSASTHTGGGGGGGQASFQDLSIIKYTDTATASLMLKSAQGSHLSEVKLHVLGGDGTKGPQEYTTILMKDVIVSSISTGGRAEGDGRATESITFNFAQFEFDYAPLTKDGSLGSNTEFNWNIPTNTGY